MNLLVKCVVLFVALTRVPVPVFGSEQTETTTLNTSRPLCQLDLDMRVDVERVTVDVEFWYAVGTTGPLSSLALLQLEQILFRSIDETTLWCTSSLSTSRALSGKRSLQDENERLGVVTLTPGKSDVPTEFDCPIINQKNLFNGTNATQCTVVQGGMSVLSQPIDRSSFAITAVRATIEATMENINTFDGNVEFISFLGSDESEALTGIPFSGNEIASGGLSGGRDNVGTLQGNESPAGNEGGDGLLIAFMFFAALLTLTLASVLSARKDKKKEFNKVLQPPVEEKPISIEYNEEDPPGSFHEGVHHYLRDGTRYYSSRCEQCREYNCVLLPSTHSVAASRMGTIPEKEAISVPSEKVPRILPRADLRLGLSQHHMGINVHTCKSAMCTRCGPNSPLPIFVTTGVVSRALTANGSSTANSSTISSINSNSVRSSAHSSTQNSGPSLHSKSLFSDVVSPVGGTIVSGQ